MRIFLIQNVIDINASQAEKYDFVMMIAKGEMKFEEVVTWLIRNTINK